MWFPTSMKKTIPSKNCQEKSEPAIFREDPKVQIGQSQ